MDRKNQDQQLFKTKVLVSDKKCNHGNGQKDQKKRKKRN